MRGSEGERHRKKERGGESARERTRGCLGEASSAKFEEVRDARLPLQLETVTKITIAQLISNEFSKSICNNFSKLSHFRQMAPSYKDCSTGLPGRGILSLGRLEEMRGARVPLELAIVTKNHYGPTNLL